MEILIALAAVAALLWASIFVARGSLIAGCLTFLTVNSCFGFYYFNQRIGPIEFTLDRLVLVLLAGSYLLNVRFRRHEPKPFSDGDWLVFALLGWFALRTVTAPFWETIAGQERPLWHLLIGYIAPLALFWIARQSPLGRKEVRLVHLFLIGFGVYLGVMALLEAGHLWGAVFPGHIADPAAGIHYGRARGPMVQSVILGFFLSICLVCTWIYRQEFGVRGRLLMLGLMLPMLAGVYFTYTRCVWMGALAALLLVAALDLARRSRFVLVTSLAILVVVFAAAKWESLVSGQGSRDSSAARDSTNMRACFAYVSWQMFLDRPLTGCGFGQYFKEKNAYLSDRSTSLRLESIRHEVHHNLFLSILVETGVVGLMLYLAVLVRWAREAWRLARDPAVPDWARRHGMLVLGMLAAYVPNALFQPVGHMNILHMMFFFLGGISSGLYAKMYLGPAASGVSRQSITRSQAPAWERTACEAPPRVGA